MGAARRRPGQARRRRRFWAEEVAIAVGGAAVVAGRLRGKVRIDDCYWVIDDDYEGGRALQVVLAKASTFTKWEGLLSSELGAAKILVIQEVSRTRPCAVISPSAPRRLCASFCSSNFLRGQPAAEVAAPLHQRKKTYRGRNMSEAMVLDAVKMRGIATRPEDGCAIVNSTMIVDLPMAAALAQHATTRSPGRRSPSRSASCSARQLTAAAREANRTSTCNRENRAGRALCEDVASLGASSAGRSMAR